ncbi:uncharacterized protein I303_100292 [Kwoniella dejecticola CBS 10117]|uniref:F-box domain-containing protein n=1 Tax=Kwoniella dejecticola CBS 10117 TaxID=1296121 RepID=A0A1A6AEI4_9TREE|nr:uncharacterized protein I303_00292 [Kwoniella dejecticola CBS 10117]OBR88475.1 hypothetical protein I303_00292 [Kwoniella dejecticola CBS 10117]
MSSPPNPSRPSALPLIPQQPHWTRPPPSPPSHTPLSSTFSRSAMSIGDASIPLGSLSINQQPIPLPTPSPGISHVGTNTGTALSPPTPAPSPSPRDRRVFRGDDSSDSDEELSGDLWIGKGKGRHRDRGHTDINPQDLLHQFTTLSPNQRFSFLSSLIGELRLNEALVVSRRIEPLLRRDFLRELPAELALHCLSFVDEPRTLARAAQVSNYWNQLLQDEQTWKDLFNRHNFPTPSKFITRPMGMRRRSTQTSILSALATTNINLNNSATLSSTAKSHSNGNVTVTTASSHSGSQGCINRATPFGLERRVLNLSSSRIGDNEDGTFKGRFKNAYLTESNWLSGGRILANHVSSDDAVVTTLCFDDSHIVVGMANNKIHVFDAITGTFLRSLLGHRQGVWAMVLVSANRNGDSDDAEDDLDDLTRRFHSNVGVGTHEGSWGGKASESYRDNGQSRRSSFAGGTTTEQHPPLGSHSTNSTIHSNFRGHTDNSLNSSSPGGIFPASQINQPARPNTAMGFTPLSSSSDHNNANNGLFGLGIARSQQTPNSSSSGSGPGSNSAAAAASSSRNRRGSSTQSQGHTAARNRIRIEPGGKMRSSDPCGCARGWKGNKHNLVVSAGCDKEVKVWNLDTGELIYGMRGHTSTIRCLKVLDKRPVAISGSRDHSLRVWDIENGRLLHVLEGHDESVRCVEIAGNMAVSGSYDYTARIWDLDNGQCLHVLRGHYHQIYSVAFDGQTVVTGSLDSTIRVWSAATGECLALLQGHTALVGQLQLSSSRLITGGSDGRVIIFDLSTLTTSHRLCAHDNSVTCLQFDDRFIVSGGNDGRVKLWDVKTGRFIRELSRPCDAVWRIGFRSDRVVLLCQREGRTCLEVISFRPGEGERRSRG